MVTVRPENSDPRTRSSGIGLVTQRTRRHLAEPLFRSAYSLIAAELLTSGLGILFWAVAARLYSTADVGRGSALVAAMLTLANFAQLNLPMGFLRFLPGAGEHTASVVRRAYAVTAVVGALVAWAFVLIAPQLSQRLHFLAESRTLAVAFVVGVPLWCVFALQDAALTAARRAYWVPVENGLFSAGKIVLMVVVAASLPANGIVVAWLLAMALTLPPVNLYLFTRALPVLGRARTNARPVVLREVTRFVAADYAGSLFNHLSTTALPLLVVSLLGAEANALFFVAWTVGTSLTLIATNTGYSLTVEGAMDEQRLAENGRRALRRCLQLVTAGAAAVVLVAPWALALFGPDYQDASDLLRLLAVAGIPASINILYLALMRVQRRLARIVTVQAAECVSMLTLTVVAARSGSIDGPGVAWLITQLLICFAILPDLRAVLRGRPVGGRAPR
jgi:O-antigen/teichoic acid export membrane protein